MGIPDVAKLDAEAGKRLVARLTELGVDAPLLGHLTEGADDLRTPLIPTREASLRDDCGAIAVRLFFCREAMEASPQHSAWIEAGLLDPAENGRVIAPFHLRLVRGLYLFSDYLADHPDAAMGAGETTAVLYHASQPQTRIGRVLDLGCGAGTLALLLARDADSALGTDVNPRAVALARFNAAVNGVENVEFRCGDLYETVRHEQFDLIVSQPPYYPVGLNGVNLMYLHGGARGDELASRILAGFPQHLAPHGRGVMFTSWPEDHELPLSPGMRILELRTDRGELFGTRQCIDVVQPATTGCGWAERFEVPSDCWGEVRSWRIDQMLHARDLLHGPVEELFRSRLRLPEGAVRFEEGGDVFLRCPSQSLLQFARIDESTWEVLRRVDQGNGIELPDLDVVRRALERGLLVPPRAKRENGE